MPHIRVRGIEKEVLIAVGKELVEEMVVVMECPKEFITLEHIETCFIEEGVADSAGIAMVEIAWFDRGQEVKQDVANAVTRIINTQKAIDRIAVYFTDMVKAHYFVNGVSY